MSRNKIDPTIIQKCQEFCSTNKVDPKISTFVLFMLQHSSHFRTVEEHQDLFFCTLKFLKFLDGGGICQNLFYLYFKLQSFPIRHESMLPCFHAMIPSSNNLQDDQSFKSNSSQNMKICFNSTCLLKASPDFHVP